MIKYCKKCRIFLPGESKYCPNCGGSDLADAPFYKSTGNYSLAPKKRGFFKRVYNDKSGKEANYACLKLGKIFMVLSLIFSVCSVAIALLTLFAINIIASLLCLLYGLAFAYFAFITGLSLKWCGALGNNILIMTHELKKRNTYKTTATVPNKENE